MGMGISKRDQEVLEALAAARREHPELADLLDFYLEIYKVQFNAKADLAQVEVRDDLAMRWRLEGGIPQLTFDQLDLEQDTFAGLVHELADVLLRHNPSWTIDWEEWTPERLLGQAQEIFETWDTLTAPDGESEERGEGEPGRADTATLAAGFALAPYLQRAAETILPYLDLAPWSRGYCPVCGGRPNLALLEEKRGARILMCSRCASQWPYSRVKCPFCQSTAKQNYYRSDDGLYRLYVCPDCQRYLKTVDLREVHRQVYPMVERLLTVGMDLAAQQEGYRG
jgi:formate dehydrogenase maturation protein FdhE